MIIVILTTSDFKMKTAYQSSANLITGKFAGLYLWPPLLCYAAGLSKNGNPIDLSLTDGSNYASRRRATCSKVSAHATKPENCSYTVPA